MSKKAKNAIVGSKQGADRAEDVQEAAETEIPDASSAPGQEQMITNKSRPWMFTHYNGEHSVPKGGSCECCRFFCVAGPVTICCSPCGYGCCLTDWELKVREMKQGDWKDYTNDQLNAEWRTQYQEGKL